MKIHFKTKIKGIVLILLLLCYFIPVSITYLFTYPDGWEGVITALTFPIDYTRDTIKTEYLAYKYRNGSRGPLEHKPIPVPGGVAWINGQPPTPIIVRAPEFLEDCTNITFTKPYTVGQKGIVSITKSDLTYISLYSSPKDTGNGDIAFSDGEELTIKEDPVPPPDYGDYFFWRVGNDSNDGWCIEDCIQNAS